MQKSDFYAVFRPLTGGRPQAMLLGSFERVEKVDRVAAGALWIPVNATTPKKAIAYFLQCERTLAAQAKLEAARNYGKDGTAPHRVIPPPACNLQ